MTNLDDQLRTVYHDHYIGRSESAAECAALLNYASGASFTTKCRSAGLRVRNLVEGQQARYQHGRPWRWDDEAPSETAAVLPADVAALVRELKDLGVPVQVSIQLNIRNERG